MDYNKMIACLLVGLLSSVIVAQSNENEQAFNQLFGERYRQVQSSPGRDDDLALAQHLLEVVPKTESHPGLTKLICQRAYDLSLVHKQGYDTALKSMQYLAQNHPVYRSQALVSIVEIQQKQYAQSRGTNRTEASEVLLGAIWDAAEQLHKDQQVDQSLTMYRRALSLATSLRSESRILIKSDYAHAFYLQRKNAKLNELIKKLDGNQEDHEAAKELAMIYVVDFNRPAAAGLYLNAIADETLINHIQLACQLQSQLTANQLLSMGQWYDSLSKQASSESKLTMAVRAFNYIQNYLDKHTQADVDRLKADLLNKKLSAQVKLLGGKITTYSWANEAVLALSFDRESIRLNNGQTVARNLVKNNNIAIIYGATQKKGVAGQALSFDGIDDYVDTQLNAATTHQTFAFWAKAELKQRSKANSRQESEAVLFGFRENDNQTLSVGYDRNKQLGMGIGSSQMNREGTRTRPDSQWHHYIIVCQSEYATLYLDGRPVITKRGSLQDQLCYFIGALHSSRNNENSDISHMPGLIDEFAIWNRPLTADEIGQLYHYAKSGKSYCSLLRPAGRQTPAIASIPPGSSRLQGWADGAILAMDFEKSSMNRTRNDWTVSNLLNPAMRGKFRNYKPGTGQWGQASQFQGNNHLDLRLDFSDTHRTIAFWAQVSESAMDQIIFGLYDEKHRFYIGYNENSALGMGLSDSGFNENPSKMPSDNRWHFYTMVREKKGYRLYIDGHALLYKEGLPNPNASYFFGAACKVSDKTPLMPFRGSIDELTIWTRSLSESEIKKIYQYSRNGQSYCQRIQTLWNR